MPRRTATCHRTVTWTHRCAPGTVDAAATAVAECLASWHREFPAWIGEAAVTGSALGILQAKAVVNGPDIWQLWRREKQITATVNRRLGATAGIRHEKLPPHTHRGHQWHAAA